MDKISIKFENCFGIGKLEKEFNFSRSNTVLIYAPNGTMKTSFANSFDCIAKGETPKDRLYQNRGTICEVKIDGAEIDKNAILVVNAESNSFDKSDRISSFLASKELKEKYDTIYTDLNTSKDEFIKKMKTISQSTDCESEFVSTFSKTSKDTFFTLLLFIRDQLKEKFEKYEFRYNDIFDKKGNVEKFLEKNKGLLTQYIEKYQELISNSTFFKKSENTFGTLQANEIVKSTSDNAFFEAGHKLILDGGIEVDSADKLKSLVEEEIKKIIADEALKKTFDKVDKAIGANIELRSFKSVIEKNNLLLVELPDYEAFKKKVWVNYLSELLTDVDELITLYNVKKGELEAILEEAKKEQDIWTGIINIFNSRFYVPFKVTLTNQEDIILKQETANLVFEYKDKNNEPSITKDKNSLLHVLSKGEQRAYYILQLLFDIEARKALEVESLLIFDDIADSFDYKNKYAIIEYIKDIHESTLFKSIILTHNFDFYRTVSSRIGLGSSVLMSIRDENREIKLVPGQYRKDVFKYFTKNSTNSKVFISLISFVRNIVEYVDGEDSDAYKKLTCCLHIKKESTGISAENVLDIYKSILSNYTNVSIDFGEKNIIDLIVEVADGILLEENINEILLENKIVLSIAIRLNAETYMKSCMPEFGSNLVTSNQTRALFNEVKTKDIGAEKILVLDKVNLMTPENIHMNAFMYEPLIDMSVNHLINLYREVKKLSE
ncbi:hypothetical protein FACS1894155_08270 [Bacteroidia bacterium]|nr:hypothetical protein FACS1894155_08270 [Bacteroidia bacterium]